MAKEEKKAALPPQTFQDFGDNELEFLKWLDAEPRQVKENNDGSSYVPISIVQEDLFYGFNGHTKFELQRDSLHAKGLVAVGRLHYRHPITKEWLFQDGSAALPYIGGLHLDFPNVHARVLLSCAKKIGKRFGQMLNRDQEDAPMDVTVSNPMEGIDELSPLHKRIVKLITGSKTLEELGRYKKDVPKELMPTYMNKVKELSK